MTNSKKKIHEKNTEKILSETQNTEGVDFYIENGFYVFTEKYLKERGYCCKNGCRHCPYGYKKKI